MAEAIYLPEDLPPGRYTLAIGVVGEDDTEPVVQLDIKGRDQEGWYPLSKMTVLR